MSDILARFCDLLSPVHPYIHTQWRGGEGKVRRTKTECEKKQETNSQTEDDQKRKRIAGNEQQTNGHENKDKKRLTRKQIKEHWRRTKVKEKRNRAGTEDNRKSKDKQKTTKRWKEGEKETKETRKQTKGQKSNIKWWKHEKKKTKE